MSYRQQLSAELSATAKSWFHAGKFLEDCIGSLIYRIVPVWSASGRDGGHALGHSGATPSSGHCLMAIGYPGVVVREKMFANMLDQGSEFCAVRIRVFDNLLNMNTGCLAEIFTVRRYSPKNGPKNELNIAIDNNSVRQTQTIASIHYVIVTYLS